MNSLRNLTLAFVGTLSTTLSAQIDRESSVLVNAQHLRHASLADVQSWVAQGYRLSNFEVASLAAPLSLNCSLVRNIGVYSAGWYFYADKTRAELLNLCNANNARIVDLERYEVAGEEQLAALLFVNTGAQQKAWYWHTGLAQGSVYSTVNGMGHRVIDLEPYVENGQHLFHVISIANTGSDQKPWWVYTNTNTAGVQSYMAQHSARLYDFELKSLIPYSCACVLVQDDITSLTLWGEFYGTGFNLDDERGGRVAGLAQQNIGSYVVTLIDNRNPFLTYGVGCVGTHGQSVHSAAGNAMTGSQITYQANHLWPWTIGIIFYGDTTAYLPLAVLGAPGCNGYVNPIASTNQFANGSGVVSVPLTVPVVPSLQGLQLVSQIAALDPGLNQLGIQVSNALVTTIRHW